MYYDQDFYNQMDNEDVDNISTKSRTRKVEKFIDSSLDKNMHKIQLSKFRTLTVYSSGDTGSKIRNAITGNYYGSKYMVGSSMEDLCFRVGISVGKDLKKLFFDSPEQYERHFGCTMEKECFHATTVKKNWVDRSIEKQLALKR